MATRCGPAMLAFVQWEQLFKALGDAQRLTLLGRLATASGPLTVTEASECCGIHISGVSRHLQILKQAGVVEAEKRGREVVYRLGERELVSTLRGVADALERCCCGEPTKETQGSKRA